jgi:2-polyprenyl-3-methyl-5-hydroxy-6-metoxy-1,4-benzoquinol methylase
MTDAVVLHSRIAEQFDAKYASSPMFKERLAVWRAIIGASGSSGDVLDAGCGSGVLSIVAAESACRVVAFDASAEMIELARRNVQTAGVDNVEFLIARVGDEGPLAQQTFDLVVCSSVLEYIEDYWRAFDWLAARLKPRGRIVFSMPNGASIYRHAEAAAYRLTGRPAYYGCVKSVPQAKEVLKGVRDRGFAVKQIQFYGAAPLLSTCARLVGARKYADTLFVVVCDRDS